MKNLDEVFLQTFIKTASALTSAPRELTAIEKLAAVSESFRNAFLERHQARLTNTGQKAKYQGALFKQTRPGKMMSAAKPKISGFLNQPKPRYIP